MAEIHGPKIVKDGLMLALDAGDINSYPGSGTSMYDLSGNGLTFTLQGNATYSTQGRGSIYLDGSSDGIQRTGTTELKRAITLVQWLKTSDTVGLMLSGDVVGTGGAYYVGAYPSSFYNSNCGTPSYFIDTKPTSNPSSPINYLDNNWHMWEAKNLDFSSWTNVWNFLGYYASYEIAGYVGGILMYNKVLTAKESEQNYNALKTRFI
jgi:hypothetical protein